MYNEHSKVLKSLRHYCIETTFRKESVNKMNNHPELSSWIEEYTSLERGGHVTGIVWPGGLEDVLAEEFGAQVMVVSSSGVPKSNDNIYFYPGKHHELPYEELQDFDIEYGWALGETLTYLAGSEEPAYSNLVEATEDLLGISEGLVADEGTSIYNVEGLDSSSYNPTSQQKESPDDLEAWAKTIHDEIDSLGYEVSIEEPPILETPHIVVEF